MGETLALNNEMIAVLAVLAFTIFLFVSEIVRVDVAAVLVMVLLGVTGMVSGEQLFTGFSSNAVISIIAVMIIGAGLDKAGIMTKVAAFILRVGGTTEKRIIPVISGTVGFISSFMQNVGAAALFLPVVARISARTQIPMSRLLMPMGFCAILGGTMTMIGSSPLILLNDLILTSNKSLPAGVEAMKTFDLFDVSPIGFAMITTGIVYFVVAGRFVLPAHGGEQLDKGNTMDYFKRVYGIEGDLFELFVPAESAIVGKSSEEFEKLSGSPFLLAYNDGTQTIIAPPADIVLVARGHLAVLGSHNKVKQFAEAHGLELRDQLDVFGEALAHTRSGIAEVVIPARSELIGKQIRELRMRKTYGTNILTVYRGGETIRENIRELTLKGGDTLVVHCTWQDLAAMDKNPDFVVASDYKHEEFRSSKASFAVGGLVLALSLIMFTDLKLSVALMAGAMTMVLGGVLKMDEAYRAVSWISVFLLASLIPLGLAFESSGAARWVAQSVLMLLGDVPTWVLQLAIAALATFFTLVMSNVGATVLLVPLAVNIAIGAGADPRIFALTVALATSNSFFIPTHQVNALIMGPAGYRNADFMRAGGVMTILFLIVLMVMLNIVF